KLLARSVQIRCKGKRALERRDRPGQVPDVPLHESQQVAPFRGEVVARRDRLERLDGRTRVACLETGEGEFVEERRILRLEAGRRLPVPLGGLGVLPESVEVLAEGDERLGGVWRESAGLTPVAGRLLEAALIPIRLAAPEVGDHRIRAERQRATECLDGAI